ALAVPATVESLAGSTLRIASQDGGVPTLEFQLAPHGDPRDALDRGADLMVTRDPAVIDYAAGRAEFAAYPLPWSRTYALLQPAGAHPIDILGLDSVRRSLAQDVAQAEARASEPPFWWRGQCPSIDLSYSLPQALSPRIVYPREDQVARGLAERIVALARDTTPLRTAGLDREEFAAAVQSQRDQGYVLDLPRQVPAPCHASASLPDGARIQPLIDTRARAILRKGAPAVVVDWDGTVRMAPL
ncbi:MAG TPA: hypothetical protein VFU40_06090, partial [Gemmatimonadales bacterium]|nr:hypothetical protein [Gemmatimonadales bacterium]